MLSAYSVTARKLPRQKRWLTVVEMAAPKPPLHMPLICTMHRLRGGGMCLPATAASSSRAMTCTLCKQARPPLSSSLVPYSEQSRHLPGGGLQLGPAELQRQGAPLHIVKARRTAQHLSQAACADGLQPLGLGVGPQGGLHPAHGVVRVSC